MISPECSIMAMSRHELAAIREWSADKLFDVLAKETAVSVVEGTREAVLVEARVFRMMQNIVQVAKDPSLYNRVIGDAGSVERKAPRYRDAFPH